MCGIAAYEIMVDNNDNIADFPEGVKGKEKEKPREAAFQKIGASFAKLAPTMEHRSNIDASRTWGPARRGGAFAPYERFRLRRKPRRRGNSFTSSISITEGWSRPLGGENQKERHASGVPFFLVRLKGLEPARIAAREPKSRMSTNSITGAYSVF